MRRDDALLLDILLAARDARSFVEGMDWIAFSESRLHQNAVVRSLEIIGEASSKVSEPFRNSHPELSWRSMTSMRNRLIHDYAGVRLAVVWDVVANDLPDLIRILQRLVPPDEPKDHQAF